MTVVCLGADALDYPEGKGGGHTLTRSVAPGIRGKCFFLSDEKLYLCARVEEA